MIKLKYNHAFLKHFVIFLTILMLSGCGSNTLFVKKVEAKQLKINEKTAETPEIEAFIKPYRDNVDKDMNTSLATANKTFDKSGEWQTPMGNLLADAVLLQTNPVFFKRENKNIDICLLNHGGIRDNIDKGDVSVRTAFEVMPFENTAIVIALSGAHFQEMANFIIKEKKPHPLAGMSFTIAKDGTATNILIQGKPVNTYKTYHIVTSDYLATGGDKMDFFKKSSKTYDLNYKLRNALIDYFKAIDELPVSNVVRIQIEK